MDDRIQIAAAAERERRRRDVLYIVMTYQVYDPGETAGAPPHPAERWTETVIHRRDPKSGNWVLSGPSEADPAEIAL